MHAVRRDMNLEPPLAAAVDLMPMRAEELVAPLCVRLLQIQPHAGGITVAGLHDAGARHHTPVALLPFHPVLRDRQRGRPPVAGHIPELEELVARVPPHAITEGRRHGSGAKLLPRLVGLDNRIRRVPRGQVKAALKRRLLHQKIIHEQLPAHFDRNHRRRRGEMRWQRGRLGRRRAGLRRPGRRELDAVVEQLTLRRGCGGGMRGSTEARE